MDVDKKSLRLKLIIFNCIFFAMSAVSICMLILKPFLTVNATYLLQADMLEEQLGAELGDQVDVDEIVGDGIEIKLHIDITPKMLIKSLTEKDGEKYVKEEVVSPIVDGIVNDIKPVITQVINSTIKSVAKNQVKEQLSESIKDAFDIGDDEVAEKLEEAGIGEAVEAILEVFEQEGAKVEDLVSAIETQAKDVINNLKQMEGVDASMLPDEITFDASFTDELTDMFKEIGLADEDGTILDIEQAIGALIGQFTGTGDSQNSGSHEPVAYNMGSTVYAEGEETSSLEDTIRDLIYDYVDDSMISTISLVLKIVAGVLGLFLLTWAWVAINCLLKSLIAKNPGIFTGVICGISSFLQIIVGLVLTFGVSLVLSGKLNISFINDLLSQIPEGFTLSIAASAMIPGFCLLAKFVMNFFYHHFKRKLKKNLKAYKDGSPNGGVNINVSVNR